jgi:hypothetical protein
VQTTLDWGEDLVPAGQWPQSYSEITAGMASEQECEIPWVGQPRPRVKSHRKYVERLEDYCSPSLPI